MFVYKQAWFVAFDVSLEFQHPRHVAHIHVPGFAPSHATHVRGFAHNDLSLTIITNYVIFAHFLLHDVLFCHV